MTTEDKIEMYTLEMTMLKERCYGLLYQIESMFEYVDELTELIKKDKESNESYKGVMVDDIYA